MIDVSHTLEALSQTRTKQLQTLRQLYEQQNNKLFKYFNQGYTPTNQTEPAKQLHNPNNLRSKAALQQPDVVEDFSRSRTAKNNQTT